MHLALFLCGELPPELGHYTPAYSAWLASAYSRDAFVLDSFDARTGQLPTDDDLDKYKAIVLSGSVSSACDNIEWINNLVAYIARVAQAKPTIKIIGICFGHQIVARAMGAQVVRNSRWEVGPTLVSLTDLGKALFGADAFHIQEMHQDHVPTVPPNFHLLGSTPVSINQGMVRFYGDRAPRSASEINPEDIHILTVQGHPEFTEPIVTGVVERRLASGAMDAETAKDALKRRYDPNDGVGIIGHAVWNVIGRV